MRKKSSAQRGPTLFPGEVSRLLDVKPPDTFYLTRTLPGIRPGETVVSVGGVLYTTVGGGKYLDEEIAKPYSVGELYYFPELLIPGQSPVDKDIDTQVAFYAATGDPVVCGRTTQYYYPWPHADLVQIDAELAPFATARIFGICRRCAPYMDSGSDWKWHFEFTKWEPENE